MAWQQTCVSSAKPPSTPRSRPIRSIPSGVGSSRNSAETFKPYDPSKITGDTSPNLPAPAASGGGDDCGGLGQILMIVVAVAVTWATAGVAAGWGWGSVIAEGAVAGAAGAAASQVVGNATGVIDGFDWKGIALGALGGAVTAGVAGNAGGLGPTGQSFGAVAARAAISNAMTQGIAVVSGLQKSFSWVGVAAAAVGAGVGSKLSEALDITDSTGEKTPSFKSAGLGEQVLRAGLTGLAAGTTTAVMRGGRISATQIAVDAFGTAIGNALGQSIADQSSGVDWSKAPDQSDAETARLNRYEGAALEQEAANNRTLLNAANGAADGDYYGPAWNGGEAFASSTAKRRQEIAAQDASSRVEQGIGSAEDIKLLKTIGSFPSPQRVDSSLMAFAPTGMAKVDGSPVTYSFNERTGQAYWNLGEDNLLREIPKAFRQPSLQDAAFADQGNPFTNGPRLGTVLAEFAAVSGAGAFGLGVGGIAARGLMGFAADTSAYGLRTAYLLNANGVNATGLLGAEVGLGYDAVSPSPMLLGGGVRNAGRTGAADYLSRFSSTELGALRTAGLSDAEIARHVELSGDVHLFRGTSPGWAGSPGAQATAVSATTDPYIATVFALEARGQAGQAVVQFGPRSSIGTFDMGNWMAAQEREVGVLMTSRDFAARAPSSVPVDTARQVLGEMGMPELPYTVASPSARSMLLDAAPKMTPGQVAEFLQRINKTGPR